MRKKEVFNVTFSAIMLSLSVVLELLFKFVIILDMPNGGGLSIAMLPVIVASIVCGWQYGLAAGIGYGLLNFLIDGYGFSLWSFIFDYILAYASVTIAAVFRKQILEGKKSYFALAVVCVFLLRWVANGLSGVINAEAWGYNAEFLAEMFGDGKTGMGYLFLYSFVVYNYPYLSMSCVFCIVVGILAYKVLFQKFVREETEE